MSNGRERVNPFSATRRLKRPQNKVKVEGFRQNISYLASIFFYSFHGSMKKLNQFSKKKSIQTYLHNVATLFRVEWSYSYVLHRIVGTSCCWWAALLSCLSICYLTVACLLLASSAATLGALGMVFMSCGCTPAVCLATGVVTLYPFFSYTANSRSAAFLWVLFSHMVQNLRDGVTPAGSRLVLSSIGTKVWSGY